MHPKFHTRRLLLGIVVVCLMVGGTVMAQPLAQPLNRSNTVIVPYGGQVRLQLSNKKYIKAILVQNPNIVSAEQDAVSPAHVILRGLQLGATRMELTDADGARETYEVVVQADIELLRNILKRAVPTAAIDVIPFGNNVVLTGFVAHSEDIDPILRITGTILGTGFLNVVNAMTVGGVHQVQLDVTVARVDRTKSRQRGFNFIVNGPSVSSGSVLGGLTASSGTGGNNTVATGVGIIPGAASALPTSATNIVFGIIPTNFQGLLQALKTEGVAKTVAEPKLVTQSGRPARFLSGGQQATLGAASGINGPGVVYQDIGTEIDFLPIVYGNGKIYLEVAPRVRGVNQGLGIVTSFGAVPGFDDQQVRTSIVLEPGQTFAIAGLIQTNLQSSATRVPVLGEMPFIGPLFSTQTVTEQETELVVMVTPHLVDPMDCNQVPKRVPGRETRSPDDFEMYLEGIMELPRGQRNVFEDHHYKGAWKNSPTASTFPCAGPSNTGHGGGSCASGACNTGNPAPAKAPMIINVAPAASPAQLPPAVSVPKDSSVPNTGR